MMALLKERIQQAKARAMMTLGDSMRIAKVSTQRHIGQVFVLMEFRVRMPNKLGGSRLEWRVGIGAGVLEAIEDGEAFIAAEILRKDFIDV